MSDNSTPEGENPLLNAPPRLSDLHGTELRKALNARHEAARANWLRTRVPQAPFVRVVERVRARMGRAQ